MQYNSCTKNFQLKSYWVYYFQDGTHESHLTKIDITPLYQV